MPRGDHYGRTPTARWPWATAQSGLARLVLSLALFLSGTGLALATVVGAPASVHTGSVGSPDGEGGAGSVQAPPVHLAIGSIGVDADLVDLARQQDGSIEVPRDVRVAGWFARGPVPGATGNAVIVGHVDSHRGAGVFHRLRALTPGALVEVTRLDGTKVSFAVDGVHQYSKSDFPSALVFGPSRTAKLRLVTCGGRFDRLRGHYRDNVVVFAHLVTPQRHVAGVAA